MGFGVRAQLKKKRENGEVRELYNGTEEPKKVNFI